MATPEEQTAPKMGLGELATAIDTITRNIEEDLTLIKSKRAAIKAANDQKADYQRRLAVEIRRLGIKTRRKPKPKEVIDG